MSTRINKPASQWREEELHGWARGDIESGRAANEKQLATILAKKLELEVGDDIAAFKEAAVEKIDGIEETAQEVPEEEAAPVEEKEESEVKEEPKAAPQPQQTAAKQEPQFPGGQKSTTLMIIEDNLAKYVAKMRPGVAHQGNDGPATQVMLYRTIQTILRQKGTDFNFAFGEFLKVVHKHRKDVFNERYIFRYMDRLTLTPAERRNFERFVSLAMTVCDPATRSHTLKQVDVDATMEGFKDPDAHQRVVAFFQV